VDLRRAVNHLKNIPHFYGPFHLQLLQDLLAMYRSLQQFLSRSHLHPLPHSHLRLELLAILLEDDEALHLLYIPKALV
jgi:hypothetical protein